MFGSGPVAYEIGGNIDATCFGGVAAVHRLVTKLGLVERINEQVPLLKVHLPYHESDHVLNLAYNVVCGGTRLEDIERLRHDGAYMNAVGADLIPDPTTAGDFCRRFTEADVAKLLEAINAVRPKLWTVKGIWGYAPLIVSLANTREVLYLVNRPGNAPSHQDAATWIDKAIDLVAPHAPRVCLRGDTDFSLTGHLDRWARRGVDFVFGMDASPALRQRAEALDPARWRRLHRPAPYQTATGTTRARRPNHKQRIVRERGYLNLELNFEDVAEFFYIPGKCSRAYRVIALRKNISPIEQVVELANERCDQENVIEQLKNGVNALRVPLYDLVSNWAYMVTAALAWNIKSWFAMMMHRKTDRRDYLRMEFRRFLTSIILIPAMVARHARGTTVRLIGYTPSLDRLFSAWRTTERTRFG